MMIMTGGVCMKEVNRYQFHIQYYIFLFIFPITSLLVIVFDKKLCIVYICKIKRTRALSANDFNVSIFLLHFLAHIKIVKL